MERPVCTVTPQTGRTLSDDFVIGCNNNTNDLSYAVHWSESGDVLHTHSSQGMYHPHGHVDV